jgi:hypothetical protein
LAELTPRAQELVRAGRDALRPSDADRERVLQALLPKLGPVAAASTSIAKATLIKSGALLVGLGVAGAGLFYALKPEEPVAAPPVVATVAPPTPPAPIGEAAPESPATVTPEAPVTEKRGPSASPVRSADGLAEEVAILSRAGAELHAGRPQAALTALGEHQRKFPNGVLTQERTAARVQALCALGRTKEAQTELARLARISPNSPHEARARKACGSALAPKN